MSMVFKSNSKSNSKEIRLAVIGAAGRMGKRLLALSDSDPRFVAGLGVDPSFSAESEASSGFQESAPQLLARHLAEIDLVIDFSAPAAVAHITQLCAESATPCIIASTGLSESDFQLIAEVSHSTAILQAANLSVGVNALLALVEDAARALGDDFETEIFEIHHRHKKDAPSGTAKALGESIRKAQSGRKDVLGRCGSGEARALDEVGYAALRGGEVSGEHTVYFFADGERLELTHRAATPDIFAA
ncbi:4-hydroxy-tetrahydrodipicolinate reductase, partial [Myxococcota bacterium]|nr:4-hydroxy-tetrahydrodipicolinate reductase [Myxococcota bacterium]